MKSITAADLKTLLFSKSKNSIISLAFIQVIQPRRAMDAFNLKQEVRAICWTSHEHRLQSGIPPYF